MAFASFLRLPQCLLPVAATVAALATAALPAQAALAPLTQDTFTLASAPAAVHGGWGSVNVSGAGARGLLAFELGSVLPAGTTVAQIQKASLIVFVEWLDAPGAIEVVRLTGAFNENTTTSSTYPPHTGLGTGKTATLVGSVRPLVIDVTDLVKAGLTSGQSTLGLAVLPATATPGVAAQLGSKEGRRPALLDITLSPTASSTFWATAASNQPCSSTCAAASPPATAVADISGNVCARPDGSRHRSTQYRNLLAPGQTSTWACGSWTGSNYPSLAVGWETERLAQCHCAR